MPLAWRDWTPIASGADPNRYLDWDAMNEGLAPAWRGAGRQALAFPPGSAGAFGAFPDFSAPAPNGKAKAAPDPDARERQNQRDLIALLIRSVLQNFNDPLTRLPPVPAVSLTQCEPPGGGAPTQQCYYQHIAKDLALPRALMPGGSASLPRDMSTPRDAVIMGVLDVGVPLGHRRTRLASGKTRILAAWQQTASRAMLKPTGDAKDCQLYLPFGTEQLTPDINRELARWSGNDLAGGYLDEEAFNRALGLEDYAQPFGQRDLGQRGSHGAHVLDAACGMAPTDNSAERLRIIAVNMPDRALIGHSAQFLDFFAVHGILRIVMLADALWHRLYGHDAGHKNGQIGFPIVLNLSFGKLAGPRDGRDMIGQVLDELNALRQAQGRAPVILSLPAGNENLERGNISARLAAGAEVEFDWRLVPEDQSANFVEIWAQGETAQATGPSPLEIQVVPPGGPASPWTGAKPGHVLDLEDMSRRPDDPLPDAPRPWLVTRVYSERPGAKQGGAASDSAATTGHRLHYLIAAKQTQLYEDTALAPAGTWQIRLRNASSQPMLVDVNVQTDQNEEPRSAINRRSRFERPEYRRFDESGRPLDSYSYPLDGAAPEVLDNSNVLRRHGTLNAAGYSGFAALAAGHRDSDGRMVPYSATGRQGPDPTPRDAPLASLPIRDGAAHFGRLAAGARDGSAVAMEGTSFAAALLSRRLAEAWLAAPTADATSLLTALRETAASEDTDRAYPGRITALKGGGGRMNASDITRVSRS